MPPQLNSRFMFCRGIKDDSGIWLLTEREPFRYRDLSDNRVHVVQEGDTLFNLAGKYLRPLPRACGFWWIIADFQPDPILDPTIKLEVGKTLWIPSVRMVTDEVFSEDRRRLH